jgi:protein-disulfide isomerase
MIIVFLAIPLPTTNGSYEELITSLKQGNKKLTSEEKEALLDENNPRMGGKEAEVTIVGFFSFDCPGSQAMHSAIREIGVNYADDVTIIHRDFPATENAIRYSLAARCAGEQEKFWPMYDRLFQQNELKPDKIHSLAQRLNIDTEQFQECMEGAKYMEEITQDMKDGKKLGVQGSPTTFINGYKIGKPIPRDIFMSIIETITDTENRTE